MIALSLLLSCAGSRTCRWGMLMLVCLPVLSWGSPVLRVGKWDQRKEGRSQRGTRNEERGRQGTGREVRKREVRGREVRGREGVEYN